MFSSHSQNKKKKYRHRINKLNDVEKKLYFLKKTLK